MTCGPWKAVRLESYNGRVAELWTDIEVEKGLKTAYIKAYTRVEGPDGDNVSFTLSFEGKKVAGASSKIDADKRAHVDFKIDSPALWYPHGYGSQPLYDISATLSSGSKELHSISKRTGVRQAELIQDKDKHGKSFYFRINNVDIFCGGSNWIPADSFTPRITVAKYRRWLELMVDGNQCMIRCWGGGIWEPDIFFELCDQLGIMVWQDFLFGITPLQFDFVSLTFRLRFGRLRQLSCTSRDSQIY